MKTKEVRNGAGKLVCVACPANRSIEVVHKGYRTILRFEPGERLTVINSKN